MFRHTEFLRNTEIYLSTCLVLYVEDDSTMLTTKMLVSDMPELTNKNDITYVTDALGLEKSGNLESESFEAVLEQTGTQLTTRLNFFVHNLVH